MKVSRIGILVSVAVALFCASAGGYFYYKQYEVEKEIALRKAAQQTYIQAEMARLAAQKLKENTRPIADKALNEGLPKAYQRPPSDWKSTEKSIYQKLLSSGQFDVLVVPFQVQEYALDRPTRSLMSAELALAVSASQKLRVPDPYLVARALGEGDRRIDPTEIYAFADKIGVKKIIWGYVGHNRNNQMALTIQLQERGSNGILNSQTASAVKNFENMAFTDTQPPIEIYQAKLPEILAAIGVNVAVSTLTKPENYDGTTEFPKTPLDMIAKNQSPALDALCFQLLAYLTPYDAERSRERFTEKSLLAIHKMTQDSRDYRVLKARSYMLLGLRPAALQVLGEPKTTEEKELLAMLNGNQHEVELYSSQIKPSIARTIAKLDADHLGSAYVRPDKNKSFATAASLKLPGKIWPFLVARSFADLDKWAQFDNIYLKQLLDREFPIKDFTAEGIIRGAATMGDVEKLQTLADLSVLNHVRKLLEIDASKWCCQLAIDRPSELDYLDLIQSIGDEDLFRRTDYFTEVQGAPARALDFLNRIENVYKGHPQFSLARAEAQIHQAESVDGIEKETLLKSAYENLFDVVYWEQGQSISSAYAFELIEDERRHDYGLYNNIYASDYPFRAYYPTWEQGVTADRLVHNSDAALRNSTYELKALTYFNEHFRENMQNDKRDALFKIVEGRFTGNPVMFELLAKNSLMKGDTQEAARYYQEIIKVQPMAWGAYLGLGNILVDNGQLDKANKLFMSFPAFKKNSNENLVGISNSAYEAGSRFYWLGEFSLATPLFKIASKKETGSDADIDSSLRLNLINGDFRGALLGSLERARRYNNSYAYRDYLGMLHAMGASKEAWDAFNVLVNQIDDSHIWESVLVAHRKEGKSEAEIASWAKQEVTLNIGKKSNRAANYLLRAGVTDRIPSPELATSLTGIALPVWRNNYANGWIVQPYADGMELILGPRGTEPNKINMPSIGIKNNGPQKTQVKSHLVYFAEAYRAIRTGNYALARATLEEASAFYDLSKNSDTDDFELSYLIPYYAFAAAKSGDVSAVEKYISDFRPQEKGFDYLLARAVITGMGGRTTESVQLLKNALYRRPFTEDRPVQTEYEYAEICKLLFEATGNSKYRELALDWAKKNQKFQPWFAWAYAMEAVYSHSQFERKRAIAMAYYLDPKSEMLEDIPTKERKIAVRDFIGRNPFFLSNLDIQTPI